MKQFAPFSAFVLVFFAMCGTARADSCQTEALRCLQSGTMVVGGVTVANGCTSIERDERCVRANPVNSCATLAVASKNVSNPLTNGQCTQVTSDANTCTRMVNGVCDSWYRQYQCWNGPVAVQGAILESRRFRNLRETYPSDCSQLTSDANCKFEATRITEGFSTRVVNEMELSRAWWSREHRYDCTPTRYEDTCGDYSSNPICQLTGENLCLGFAPDGSCDYEQVKYHCQADASFSAQCEGINVCVGENCLGVEVEANEDFPKAAAWLNFLDNASKENSCDAEAATDIMQDVGAEVSANTCVVGKLDGGHLEPAVFKGKLESCRREVVNCCSSLADSALCSPSYAALRKAKLAGTTSYLGSTCTQRFLGMCLARVEEYCVYDSKFSRVFQEQAHLQTGSQLNTDCAPLTIQQLEEIDVNQMDLSEVFGDMLDQVTKPVEQLVIDKLSTQMGVFTTKVQETFE